LKWAAARGIDLKVRKGEIVGVGGLDGQGQRELLLALFVCFASRRKDQDRRGAQAHQQPARGQHGQWAWRIPEDRKTDGLVLPLTVRDNISLASLNRFARSGFISARQKCARLMTLPDAFDPHQRCTRSCCTLSGGNNRKL